MRADGSPGPIDVLVIDISATGVRIATGFDLDVGQEITIGLAGAGTTRAFVAWKRDGQFGCQFERPLEPEGAARAFSHGRVVHLGARQTVQEPAMAGIGAGAGGQRRRDDLRDLYVRHRAWRLPLDAILMLIAEAALVAGAVWWFTHR